MSAIERLLQKKYNEVQSNLDFKPIIYNLSVISDYEKISKLLEDNSITVYDEILGQIKELIKSNNPTIIYEDSKLTKESESFLEENGNEKYGNWVYYPWNKKLLHILPENDFIEVRTNRNQYKITKEERNLLSQKKVGVIGLSVGQSVALTMAMERCFGEIRLADFDLIELSNLNRIRTGLDNLNLPKTIIAAREIAEIDPYLNVKCFSDGINEENITAFFTDGGKLDVLIEECDGLDIKIKSRLKAKELKIPVIMDTSDRGMLDIERFDLEQDRPILHGLIDHLDLSKVNSRMTNEEKIPFILPMVGGEMLSERLQYSMKEVRKSITTWPQLASGVTLGGAITCDTYRRIILGKFTKSGRYYVDLPNIIK